MFTRLEALIIKAAIWAMIMVIIGLSTWLGFRQGYEEGYWDHESEENAYACEVI